MPRRNRPAKRALPPDARYHSLVVQEFINRMMRRGKKSVATSVMYRSLDLVSERAKREAIEVFDQALKNVAAVIEVKRRRVGGGRYQGPGEVHPDPRMRLAMALVLVAA